MLYNELLLQREDSRNITQILKDILLLLPKLNAISCTEAIIKDLPKADIHVHLPGTISPELAWILGVKNGFLKWSCGSWIDNRLLSPNNPHKKYSNIFLNFQDIRHNKYPKLSLLQYNIMHHDFNSFDKVMATVQGHRFPPGGIQSEEDLLLVLSNYLQQCLKDNIIYTEVQQNIRLAHILYPYLTKKYARMKFYKTLFNASQMFHRQGITLRFLNCFNKTFATKTTSKEPAQEAAQWLKEVNSEFPGLFVGIQSAGSESSPGACPQLLSSGYRIAYDLGLGCEAHAGEGTGFHYLQNTINTLPLHRIAHGFQAIENPDVIEAIRDRKITLVMAPIINLILGANLHSYHNGIKINKTRISSLNEHPFFDLFRQHGLKIALSSDNPQMGGISLQNTIMILCGLMPSSWSLPFPLGSSYQSPITLRELIELVINGITVAFAEEETKIVILKQVLAFLTSITNQKPLNPQFI
ncbi:Adenine deaminase,adenosine deaminase,Adenosine deaminase,adenosine deaminase,Adenosine/AMP deaminase [Chlamydia serpentis]|uniref:Adenine deaminase,adenosine deaminase,Adenosine deaminase,adenosine deaminase,Adenosine/AMP deaminase n=1 Tax=Chlamydia serpentis TaxID=1967782 RepID=A0A2R8FAE4_9CHLA|nr:adenosine deaminase [Chlamydia serpentis]SPN73331.1 Adenine deaminase,adenosine deaminase,Adenosine deaminase,adenosine deaminase,Adenosine/AMP deaminase [Chlamydia serpentis]